MEHLLEAARITLWEIVNTIDTAEPTPRLRVALLSYGTPRNDRSKGWVRVEADLTSDLDRVAERLFELETGGGLEYVARAVQVAVRDLSWTPSRDALKLMLVAGNEPADQDPELTLAAAAALALDEGISVTALYCGRADQSDADGWKALAESTAGSFSAIDHRSGAALVASPYDGELARLGAALNDTYVPLGESGQRQLERVIAQDANAARLGRATAAGRARTKARAHDTSGWDLVSALERGAVELADVDRSELPEELQSLSAEELETTLETRRTRRRELQREIAELTALRRRHVMERSASVRTDPSLRFDVAVRRVLRDQLEHHGFTLEP